MHFSYVQGHHGSFEVILNHYRKSKQVIRVTSNRFNKNESFPWMFFLARFSIRMSCQEILLRISALKMLHFGTNYPILQFFYGKLTS